MFDGIAVQEGGRMKFKLEVLTPVHIGSGKETNPAEYYVDPQENRLYHLNTDALARGLSQQELEKLIGAASKQRYIGDIFDPNLLKSRARYVIPLNDSAKYYLQSNRTIIKEYIKTAGRVYIPGSSLKGVFLSALMWHVLKENFGLHRATVERILTTRTEKRSEDAKLYGELLDLSLGLISGDANKKRFAHWYDISDSDSQPSAVSLEVSLARVAGARRGGELQVLYETLKPGQAFTFDIKPASTKFSEKEIIQIAHDYYQKVLEHDRADIEKGQFLLRIGQGVTAYSTSLLILAAELGISDYRVSPPRTRKRIDETTPMGFVRLSY